MVSRTMQPTTPTRGATTTQAPVGTSRPSLRGLPFDEQERALTRGLDATPGPVGTVQARAGAAGSGAQNQDPYDLVMARVSRGEVLSTPGDWALLAKRVRADAAVAKRDASKLAGCLKAANVCWESVTEDQRAVFMALPDREPLRKELLTHSALFNAITHLHVPKGGGLFGGVKEAHDASKIEQKRLREGGEASSTMYEHDGSVAKPLMTGEIARPALIEPVRTGRAVANKRLAAWVGKVGDEAVEQRLYELACGITNLFALAKARGQVQGGDVPTEDDAAQWLFGWSLGHGAGLLDSDGASCTYHPSRVMAALSTAKRTGRAAAGQAATPTGGPNDYGALGKVVESCLKAVKLGPQEQSRLALVQGSQQTHTFFLYKDLDAVWRPMDAYLNLEDLAGEEAGGFQYSQKISTLYFAVDKR